MLTFEGQSQLNPTVFNSFKTLPPIEEYNADSCGSCPDLQRTRSPWGRDHIVAGYNTSRGRMQVGWDLGSVACNQHRCDKMQERWKRHVELHHKNTKNSHGNHPPESSPSVPRSTSTPEIFVYNDNLEAQRTPHRSISGVLPHTQAKTYSVKSTNVLRKNTNFPTIHKQNRGEIPLRHKETEILKTPKRNLYKQYLQDIILKWFLTIPMSPTMNNKIRLKRLKVINQLVDAIDDESIKVDDSKYNDEVRHQIELCLDELPMWYPGPKADKSVFRNNLCKLLLKKIEKLNEKWLFITNEDKRNVIASYNVRTFPYDDSDDDDILRLNINNWVNTNIKIINPNIDSELITDLLFKILVPILISKSGRKYMLRAQIIKVLDELSEYIEIPKNKTMHLNKLSIELMLRLLRLKYKMEYSNKYIDEKVIGHCDDGEIISSDDDSTSEEITNIRTFSDDSEEEIFKEVTDIMYDRIDSSITRRGNRQDTLDDICTALKSDEELVSNLTETLEDFIKCDDITLDNKGSQSLSGTLVILTSEHDFIGLYDKKLPLTSTPLYQKEKKEPEKFNCCEKNYMNKVAGVVKEWLNTTDMKFHSIDDNFLKETIANDIADEVKDLAKLSQIQENMMMSYFESVLAFIIMKAILKYSLLKTPPTSETLQVIDLRERIKNLGMTEMMTPQHGNRQRIANIKFRCENATGAVFKADPLDILEDNISIWLNAQPASTINIELDDNNNRERRKKLLTDVARKVEDKIKNKASENEIKEEFRKWLKQIVNPQSNKDIDVLAEDLKNKVMRMRKNETINKSVEKRARTTLSDDIDLDRELSNMNTDTDEQLKHFIDKFIEQNYNVSDSLARGAFANILLQELLKTSPALRKEACAFNAQDKFNPDKFRKELEHIEEVSDWLKNIPFYPMLTSGNDRFEFVNGLAKNIANIEEERIKHPGKMDYELMLHTNIFEYMKQLPIPPQHGPDLVTCINQLRERIAKHRPQISSGPVPKQPSTQTVKHEHHFAKFIEEFLDLHKVEIGEDKVNLEAYISRLLKEIKRMVLQKADSDKLSNADVYNRLADVPIPGKESIQRFSIEMKYAHEIADWLHNFPLIPLRSREDVEARMRMISDLAEKIVDQDLEMIKNPNDSNANNELDNYIADWIDKLDLNPNKEIVVPIFISQLKNRINNINRVFEKQQPQIEVVHVEDGPIKSKRCDCIQEETSISSIIENPGDLIVQAIESWCKNLPIDDKDEDATNVSKAKVATSLFKKVGVLKVDPQVANDNLLYKEMLGDEIENELQKLSHHNEIISNKENLKESFLDLVMDTKKAIKEMSAGENYKQALENTINASLPNPVHTSNKIDPGFELYKHRMAMLWILENYDYATDFNSMKYKKKLYEEIEKYSDEPQKRNVFPMEKHEVFNQIFSALYKQNAPDESSIVDEVQYIKMRCEIDAWTKELPLKKALGYNELLKRDQIFTLLAKRLYDIEKMRYPDSGEKMRKEILKWLKKLPILPDEEGNITKYAAKLICNLKATEDMRICKREPQSNKSSSKLESHYKSSENYPKTDLKLGGKENTSQLAGPSGVKPKPCCGGSLLPRQKAGDLITSAIETWCKQLPLTPKNANDTETIEHLKDEAIIKLYRIINDLHADPNILNNEGLYEYNLNVEIEKLLSGLPGCCELQQTRNARKQQLIKELLAVKPMIKDDLDREGYKQNLKHTISTFLDKTTNNTIVVNDNVKDNVVDNFIQYSFHADDFDDKYVYKLKINEVLADLLLKNKDKTLIDPLLTSNQLICEMSKIKPPKVSILLDEVQEIRIKNAVGELFNEIQVPEDDEDKIKRRDQMKLVLAKKLIDIEKAGQNSQKIKNEINKALKKLGAEISPENVDVLVSNLNKNEDESKAPTNVADSCYFKNRNHSDNTQIPSGPSLVTRTPQQSYLNVYPGSLQTSETPPYPISSPQQPSFMPQSPKTSKPASPTYSENVTEMSTPSRPPNQNSNLQSPSSVNQLDNPDSGSSRPRIDCREPDKGRPVIVNGLSNNLTEDTATITTKALETQDRDKQKNNQRNAATAINANNFGECKCTHTKKMPDYRGRCKQNRIMSCDCEVNQDCNCMHMCYPCSGAVLGAGSWGF